MSEEEIPVPAGRYAFLPVDSVVFGPGSLRSLPDLLDHIGAARILLVTTRSVRATPIVSRVRTLLRDRLTGVFSDVRQHSPSKTIDAAVHAVEGAKADALVSLGGGSVIDSVKGSALEWNRLHDFYLPHVAVPTTLSAAEFSPFFGTTDERTHTKTSRTDANVTPRAVILDAEVTRYTPAWLWFGSGIRAVDHAVETLCAPDAQPITDTLALEALRTLFRFLPKSGPAESVDLRQRCMVGAWMSFFGVQNVSLGLSHTLGRQLGPRYDIPHGVTSAIILPHVLRRFRSRSALAHGAIAAAIGVSNVPDALEDLVRSLELPTKLRDVGVPEGDLPSIALGDEDALAVLRAAW